VPESNSSNHPHALPRWPATIPISAARRRQAALKQRPGPDKAMTRHCAEAHPSFFLGIMATHAVFAECVSLDPGWGLNIPHPRQPHDWPVCLRPQAGHGGSAIRDSIAGSGRASTGQETICNPVPVEFGQLRSALTHTASLFCGWHPLKTMSSQGPAPRAGGQRRRARRCPHRPRSAPRRPTPASTRPAETAQGACGHRQGPASLSATRTFPNGREVPKKKCDAIAHPLRFRPDTPAPP
jgi:hypothetical protein